MSKSVNAFDSTRECSSSLAVITPLAINRMSKPGDLILSLYNVNQQRLIGNGGSVLIGDRLYIEIKYRTGLIATCDH